jgi:hypothetical protein
LKSEEDMVRAEARTKTRKAQALPAIKRDIEDKNIVLFQGPQPAAAPGTVQLHSLGTAVQRVFGRDINDVTADFRKISDQVNVILKDAFKDMTGDMKMDSVEVSLGFTASGKLAFIAEAGVEASLTLTFKRP